MTFDFNKVKALLVCPESRSQLIQDGDSLICLNPDCRLRFAIRDDIPIMLADDAAKLAPEEWSAAMLRHGRDGKTGVERTA